MRRGTCTEAAECRNDVHREDVEIDRYHGVTDCGGAIGRRLGGTGEIGCVAGMMGESRNVQHIAQRGNSRESGAIPSKHAVNNADKVTAHRCGRQAPHVNGKVGISVGGVDAGEACEGKSDSGRLPAQALIGGSRGFRRHQTSRMNIPVGFVGEERGAESGFGAAVVPPLGVTYAGFQLDASVRSNVLLKMPLVTPLGNPANVGVVVATPAVRLERESSRRVNVRIRRIARQA